MAGNVKSEDPAYPNDLKVIEEVLLRKRQGLCPTAELKNRIGFGLSGGGIRSATFCLGLFQGLAKQHLLSKIDYMSTVSGGGYFGAFYGRLFTRTQVTEIADVEDALTSRSANQEKRHASGAAARNELPEGKVFRWLRENGRYLAPNGSGDLLLGSAVYTRNLLAVQLVLLTFALMGFLAAQLIRGLIELNRDRLLGVQDYLILILKGLPSHSIWWSPYTLVFPIVLALFVVPPAWSYWLWPAPRKLRRNEVESVA